MDFKEEIALGIAKVVNLNAEEIKSYIEIPKEESNGDYAFPCFKLAKELRQSPVKIAANIKENIEINQDVISKIEDVNGYLNFFVSKEEIVKTTINKFKLQKENYGKSEIGKGKTVIVEYSSPNIAKPFHIGHLKTTIIGNSLYKIYQYLGFNTIGINHLGDYGTQFAKLIEGYKRWGNEYDFETEPIDKLADIYKRINEACKQDEAVLEQCRDTFKRLEDGDEYCTELWNRFKELSLKEFNKIYDLLGIKFDSLKGEAFYANKKDEIISLLEKSGKLTESHGAKIVDLKEEGIDTPCIIQKADGTSIYATRDLAAILYRIKTYDFDKCLYVVGEEQSLYFKQIFAIAKILGVDEKYVKGLEHVNYGMIRLPEGKMSSRKGNFVKVTDLLNEAITKSMNIIESRDIANKELVAKQVGIGAIIFDDLAESRVKNQVFDLNAALNFNGETGPYIQYMAVRTKSVLEKAGYIPEEINESKITDDASIKIIKLIDNFYNIIIQAMEKSEPSIISKYLIELAKSYSYFYGQNKIICEDKELQDARLYITYMTKVILTNGLGLLGIEVPDKM